MSKSKPASELIKLYESLDGERQKTLIEYAEFLLSKGGAVKKIVGEPVEIQRPEQETVVGALKRLKQTYPMVESMTVFSAASSLMTEHMVNGRDTIEVINEIEILFEKSYQKLRKEVE